jgi:hypothetical protein
MLSEPITSFLEKYRAFLEEKAGLEALPKIHVDEIAAKIAAFYERVRNIIDYQEEHLLRKRFIDRTLRRKLLLKSLNGQIAEPLIKELIRSGHLPNDSVPENKIKEVERIINAFHGLNSKIPSTPRKKELSEWLLKATISAVEETLFSPTKSQMLSKLMFDSIRGSLSVGGAKLANHDIDVQLFMAVQKSLFRVDNDQLNYRLFKFLYPDWSRFNFDPEKYAEIAVELPAIKKKIERYIYARPVFRREFLRFGNRYNTVFYLIDDLAADNKSAEKLEEILTSEEKLAKAVKAAYQRRYDREKTKLNKLAFWTLLSFFISKIAVAIAVEIPVDKYLTHNFSMLNTVINILFPPVIMFLILASVKMPSAKNLGLILEEVKKTVFLDQSKAYAINIPKKRTLLGKLTIQILYLALMAGVFYELSRLLLHFKFSLANIIVFIFFTSLVAAVGVKIHNRSRELSLEKERVTLFSFLIDLISLPFVTVGKIAIAGLSKFNVLILVANFLIELPLQIFIEFLENFSLFIKSKKEEIN